MAHPLKLSAFMPRRFGLACAALAMFFIAGGHWTALQTVAWAEMLHDYSQHSGSLAVAVEQTFDGQHPCELCRDIQAGKSKEHRGSPSVPIAKADAKVKAALAEATLLAPARPSVERFFPALIASALVSRDDSPPTPPPRGGKLAA